MPKEYRLTDFLPTTKKETDLRGWDYVDVVLFSGDAYVDHPSFAGAVVGRCLESYGLRVALVPQPDWHGDYRDFKKFGKPRMFFAVSSGCMDSMVNHYTAGLRKRSDDAYSPDGKAGFRPDRCTTVYTKILKELFPDVPVVIGGLEASLRRLTHYDYWDDTLMPTILATCGADLLIYGMGELPLKEIANRCKRGESIFDMHDVPQTSYLIEGNKIPEYDGETFELFPHLECCKDKMKQAKNFRVIEEESNKMEARRLIQRVDKNHVTVVNPPFPVMESKDLDASFDLPYTRLPHPKYKGKRIPAYDMIKFSINIHRGCFGGCSFCAISAHQGKHITSRSKESIMREVREVCEHPEFKGYLSDLGGPSANMYEMRGRNQKLCKKCKRPSCAFPKVCPNMNTDHSSLIALYKEVDKLKKIKKSFIGSGVRYDLILHEDKDPKANSSHQAYAEELITNHVSGRLKVAPEHTEDGVLCLIRKPSFSQFEKFKKEFDRICGKAGLRQQIIPYFISSHPGCHRVDMAMLAARTKAMGFNLEQVQDFTPTPMTFATEMYYTGINPYTLEKVYTPRTKKDKEDQRKFFFWYKKEYKQEIIRDLKSLGRPDIIKKLFG